MERHHDGNNSSIWRIAALLAPLQFNSIGILSLAKQNALPQPSLLTLAVQSWPGTIFSLLRLILSLQEPKHIQLEFLPL